MGFSAFLISNLSKAEPQLLDEENTIMAVFFVLQNLIGKKPLTILD